jgi:hypothetical protein
MTVWNVKSRECVLAWTDHLPFWIAVHHLIHHERHEPTFVTASPHNTIVVYHDPDDNTSICYELFDTLLLCTTLVLPSLPSNTEVTLFRQCLF